MKKDIDFLVVDCPSSYNMIIGWLALNKFKASTSTYYLKMKFPMENGVGEVWGDQAFAQECYQAVLAAEENHTWIVKEAKPEKNHEEELEEIQLEEADRTKITKIGARLEPEMKSKVTQFLGDNQDVFDWTHEDMLGIEKEVIVHHLSVDPMQKLVQQKRRVFSQGFYCYKVMPFELRNTRATYQS